MWCLILLVLAALLGGCEQQLSKEQAELLDAMIFAIEGVEDNTQQKHTLRPWTRTVTGTTVELTTLRNNSIFWSDDETNAKTRPSKFIRYSVTISSPEKCVFKKRSRMEWSRGESQTEFGAYTSEENLIIDLNKAYRFEIELNGPTADVHLEGPGVVCVADLWCHNEWSKQIFPPRHHLGGEARSKARPVAGPERIATAASEPGNTPFFRVAPLGCGLGVHSEKSRISTTNQGAGRDSVGKLRRAPCRNANQAAPIRARRCQRLNVEA
jgi:hypothetical protein